MVADLLRQAQAEGVEVVLDRIGAARLRAASAPSADLVAKLRTHRQAITAMLEAERRMEFEERAAIMEFDGGLSRAEAEHRAAIEVFGNPQPIAAKFG